MAARVLSPEIVGFITSQDAPRLDVALRLQPEELKLKTRLKWTLLHLAACTPNLEVMTVLLGCSSPNRYQRIDVNDVTPQGNTALHVLALNISGTDPLHYRLVLEMLRAEANPRVPNSLGKTARQILLDRFDPEDPRSHPCAADCIAVLGGEYPSFSPIEEQDLALFLQFEAMSPWSEVPQPALLEWCLGLPHLLRTIPLVVGKIESLIAAAAPGSMWARFSDFSSYTSSSFRASLAPTLRRALTSLSGPSLLDPSLGDLGSLDAHVFMAVQLLVIPSTLAANDGSLSELRPLVSSLGLIKTLALINKNASPDDDRLYQALEGYIAAFPQLRAAALSYFINQIIDQLAELPPFVLSLLASKRMDPSEVSTWKSLVACCLSTPRRHELLEFVSEQHPRSPLLCALHHRNWFFALLLLDHFPLPHAALPSGGHAFHALAYALQASSSSSTPTSTSTDIPVAQLLSALLTAWMAHANLLSPSCSHALASLPLSVPRTALRPFYKALDDELSVRVGATVETIEVTGEHASAWYLTAVGGSLLYVPSSIFDPDPLLDQEVSCHHLLLDRRLAAFRQSPSSFRQLEAFLSAPDASGMTPLSLATQHNLPEMALWLLAHGYPCDDITLEQLVVPIPGVSADNWVPPCGLDICTSPDRNSEFGSATLAEFCDLLTRQEISDIEFCFPESGRCFPAHSLFLDGFSGFRSLIAKAELVDGKRIFNLTSPEFSPFVFFLLLCVVYQMEFPSSEKFQKLLRRFFGNEEPPTELGIYSGFFKISRSWDDNRLCLLASQIFMKMLSDTDSVSVSEAFEIITMLPSLPLEEKDRLNIQIVLGRFLMHPIRFSELEAHHDLSQLDDKIVMSLVTQSANTSSSSSSSSSSPWTCSSVANTSGV